jgi:hypothetical protein
MLGKAEKQVNAESGIAIEGGKIQPRPLECPAARKRLMSGPYSALSWTSSNRTDRRNHEPVTAPAQTYFGPDGSMTNW